MNGENRRLEGVLCRGKPADRPIRPGPATENEQAEIAGRPIRDECRWEGQATAGSALILLSASTNASRQGQRAGRCKVKRRALRVSRPGSAISRRRIVRAVP